VTDAAQELRIKEHGSSVVEKSEPKKMQGFRELVLSRMSRFWSDSKDIKLAIHETLNEFSRRVDIIGWIRPQHEPDMPALTDAMARLSNENARLKQELSQNKQGETFNGLTMSELKAVLKQKDLMSYISLNWKKLIGGVALNSDVAQLVALGLVSQQPNSSFYAITKRGQEIVNRLEYEMNNPNLQTESKS
jgi:hypothetical protein